MTELESKIQNYKRLRKEERALWGRKMSTTSLLRRKEAECLAAKAEIDRWIEGQVK